MPVITIATVTYNAVATLERTLKSVAAQDYPRVEHLIVDGRSTDGTLSLVQSYVEKNMGRAVPHTIRLISEHDDGLYDAMNKALQMAAGDYIVFLNAGDCLHEPTTLSQMVDGMEWQRGRAVNPAVVYGETDLVDDAGHFVRHRRLHTPEHLSWKSFRQGMLVCHQSFYVRIDLARAEQYDLSFRFSADYDWCIRVMKRAERRRLPLHNTHLILTDYLNEGMTTRNHRRSLMERLRLMAHHYGWPSAIGMHLWFVVRAVVKR
ncbi:MAG: glycosyltransferase [Bacteroidaceae bacterium]|nr:glycosyltransferase [Bacteroidaceae bacterium]